MTLQQSTYFYYISYYHYVIWTVFIFSFLFFAFTRVCGCVLSLGSLRSLLLGSCYIWSCYHSSLILVETKAKSNCSSLLLSMSKTTGITKVFLIARSMNCSASSSSQTGFLSSPVLFSTDGPREWRLPGDGGPGVCNSAFWLRLSEGCSLCFRPKRLTLTWD